MQIAHSVQELRICGIGQRTESKVVHRCLGTEVRFQYYFCHDTVCAPTASSDRQKYLGVLARVRDDNFARRKHNRGLEKIVAAHAICAREKSVT
nr:hypothetical protein [Tanacetum cinerariifolium]